MSVPSRFILGLAAGLVLGIALFVALLYSQVGVPTYSSSWSYDIAQKKRALAAAISGPRLLLVGGSSTTFGLSAQTIEAGTGVRTLNMGTHAGWGPDYLLYWIEQTARPGDTVLLAIEYQLFTKPIGSEPHDDYILSRDPAFFRQMSLLDKIDMATRISFKRIQKGLNIRHHGENPPRSHPPYTQGASYIDSYGDETGNIEVDRRRANPDMEEMAEPLVDGIASTHTAGFDEVRRFIAWAKAHDVTVLATFPNIVHRPEYDGENAREAIKVITDFYTAQGVPVVGTAQEAMYPPDQFFELPYHLTHDAAITRTQKLVPELKPYLKR
jgi:hypothetical protein